MNYQSIDGVIGLYQPNWVYTVDTTQRVKPGTLITAVDNYWGYGEFIYVCASASIRMGGLVTLQPALVSGALQLQATECASTAGQGRSVGIACATMTVGQFGWVCLSGMAPASAGATAAAGAPIGIFTGPGQITGTLVVNKGILNAVAVLPPTTTVVKAGCKGISGQFSITVPNAEGWFVGCTLSGTGIGSSALITAVSPDQKTVTVSVANSAAVTGSITATYTNFVVVMLSRATLTQVTA